MNLILKRKWIITISILFTILCLNNIYQYNKVNDLKGTIGFNIKNTIALLYNKTREIKDSLSREEITDEDLLTIKERASMSKHIGLKYNLIDISNYYDAIGHKIDVYFLNKSLDKNYNKDLVSELNKITDDLLRILDMYFYSGEEDYFDNKGNLKQVKVRRTYKELFNIVYGSYEENKEFYNEIKEFINNTSTE